MSNNTEMIKIADDLYDCLAMKVKEMYDTVGNELEDTNYEEVITEYDEYMQNMLFLMAISDGKFVENELSFLQNVYWMKSSFSSYMIELFNELPDNIKKDVENKLKTYLAKVPLFVKLSVLMDKHCDNLAIINKPTYCQTIFDNLLRLPTYLEFIDDDVVASEMLMERTLLAPIRKYYEENHVTFARNRGEKNEI